MSKITLNIVEPGSSTPVDPGINPAVPNTGLFTHGIGAPEATIIVSAVLILAIVSIVLGVYMYRRHKKAGKTTKLLHMVDQCKEIITSKKRITASLAAIALLVSAGTFVALARNGANAADTDETPSDDESGLTVDVSSKELTIEVSDEPVFAVLPVEVSVEEATQAGYTLMAFTDSTDLVSTTNPSDVIPMVAASEDLSALTNNTWGLSLSEPASQDDEAYVALSTSAGSPTILKTIDDYSETPADDITTIYYGFYITPNTPYGTYTGSDIYYNAAINTTPVTFDGNGLYFNEDEQQTTNEIEYIAVPEEGKEYTINQIISGEYKEPSQDLPYIFLGWSEEQEATTPTYTSAEDLAQNLPILPNQPIILYAIWQKATTITFDTNGGAGTMTAQTIIAGESDNLNPNEFTREGYTFTGWNTEAEPTEQEPGKAYADQAEYAAPADSGYVTLYAQWKALPVIGDLTYMQDFATLTEEDKASVLNSMTQEQQYQLEDSRDHKVYYISRLKDDNIWMTQNLDLDIEAGRTYTSTDTDLTNSIIGDTWTPSTSTSTTSSWTSFYTAPFSYDPGDRYWNGTPGDSSTSSTGDIHYHIGNYYNWTATVAMSDSSAYTTDQQDVNQSICPAGWRLPNLSENKSYQNLANKQGITSGISGNIQSAPTYFVYGGAWVGIFVSVGDTGNYWSSVVNNSDIAYRFNFNVDDDYLRFQDTNYRDDGYSLRCVMR